MTGYVDAARETVVIDGVEHRLTYGEFAIVSELAKRSGRPVSQHMLAGLSVISTNAVAVLVCRIRKTLGRDAVETYRTHGYLTPLEYREGVQSDHPR